MTLEQKTIVQNLIQEGERRFNSPRQAISFETGIPEAEQLVNDIERFTHGFVCACVMDRQIKAGRAW